MIVALHALLGMTPQSFLDAWDTCGNATMVDRDAAIQAHMAVTKVDRQRVPGAIVELGVFLGGMSCLMAMAHHRRDRHLWLFDTFEGLPPPTAEDDVKSQSKFRLVNSTDKALLGRAFKLRISGLSTIRDGKWCYGPLDEVVRTMARARADPSRTHFVVGKVEETLYNDTVALPSEIAILRLDTDWYTSTKAELDVLWPRLSPGGWLSVDDYATWGGARRAVNEWLQARNWSHEATAAKAFPGRHNVHRFTLWKSDPYSEAAPFRRNVV